MSGSSSASKSDYAKEQETRHRRKIVLPCVIPWEYGSNKYASQKGSGGFGSIRDATVRITSSKQLSESNEGVVPQITCPTLHKKLGSQAGETSFGSQREQVTKVKDKDAEEKVPISTMEDRYTVTILKKWAQPNHEATNADIGKRRNEISETTGGRRFTKDELNASRAAIPRFQDPRQTIAAQNQKIGEGFQGGMHRQRQATTSIDGLDRTVLDQLDTNRYMAWLGGQLTLQSQSQTGGFSKPRDVVSNSYYDKIMRERELDPKEIRKRLEAEKKKREEDGEKSDDEEKDEDKDSGHNTLSED